MKEEKRFKVLVAQNEAARFDDFFFFVFKLSDVLVKVEASWKKRGRVRNRRMKFFLRAGFKLSVSAFVLCVLSRVSQCSKGR